MAKTCIFCGERPQSKNKEHVIPQWLIKMTGDPNRIINLGADTRQLMKTGETKLLTYSFNAFTFPACEDCNLEAAKLEGRVKGYIEKIFAKDYLNRVEIDDLLDWLDKVRIGLWLGGLKLDGIEDEIRPGFYINKRIGHRDRSLLIYEMKDTVPDGINMVGTTSPGFQRVPSCFALRINNLFFYNISYDFLFARRIGFPYPEIFAVSAEDERGYHLKYSAGTDQIKLPLLDFKLQLPGIAFHQPIIAKETADPEYQQFFSVPYVQERLMNKYKGAIFYEEGRNLCMMDDETEIRLEGYQELDPNLTRKQIGQQVMRTTEDLLLRSHDTRYLDSEQRKVLKSNIKTVVKAHRDMMNANIKTIIG
ncbi:MAG: hypothetical protein ACTHMI_24130 [Mucilaginibacter sp.]